SGGCSGRVTASRPERGSEPAPAAVRATAAAQAPFVVAVAVVHGQFLAGRDVAQGVELRAFPQDADECVRGAGVIDVAETAARPARIDGPAACFHDGDDALTGGAAPRLRPRHHLAFE